jgi:hypothetical protein
VAARSRWETRSTRCSGIMSKFLAYCTDLTETNGSSRLLAKINE